MSFFVEVDSEGVVLEIYADSIGHVTVKPASATKITDDEAVRLLYSGKFADYQLVKGALVYNGPNPEIVPNAEAKIALLSRFDEIPFTQAQPVKTFDELKAEKAREISTICQVICEDGVTSNALGIQYLYPTKVLDQQNLNANVTDSLMSHAVDWATMHICQDAATKEWAYRAHTAAQIQQVGAEVKARVLANLVHHSELQKAVALAKSQVELDAITW